MQILRSLLSFSLCIFCFYSTIVKSEVIEVELLVDINYKPYSYLEYDQVLGIYPELLRAAFSLMPDYKLKLTASDWTSAKEVVNKGDALGIVGILIRGADMQNIHPFSIGVGKENVVVICHPNALDVVNPKWPEDYQGLLIGNIEGFDGWLNYQVRSEEQTKNINFLEVPTTKIAFDMVSKGRVDCSLLDEVSYYSLSEYANNASKSDNTYRQPVVSANVFSRTTHIGYSYKAFKSKKFPYAFDFQHALDTAIFKLEESGKSDEIRKKYTSIILNPF